MRPTFLPLLGPLLLWTLTAPAHATPFRHELLPADRQGYDWQWPGGTGSLPYGHDVTLAMILRAAIILPGTQPALDAMTAAGFLRRADLDVAFNSTHGSVAVLAFEQPGYSPNDRQPFVMAVTRDDDYRYFTQVLGAMIQTGPDGRPVMVEGLPANFLVEGHGANGLPLPIPQPETGPGPQNPLLWSTAYDIKRGDFPSAETVYYATGLTPCHTAAIRSFAIDAGAGAFWGAVSGARAGGMGIAWGAAIGAGAAATNWALHSTPCP
jgi:hypothetical protein